MKYKLCWSLKINFIYCRPNLDLAKFKEQYIDDEITLNEKEVMNFSNTQKKFFMVNQGSLENLVHCTIPKECSIWCSILISVVKKVVGTATTFSVVKFVFLLFCKVKWILILLWIYVTCVYYMCILCMCILCMYVYIYTYNIYLYIYIYIYICICMYCMYMYMYIYIYIYIYIISKYVR